MKIYHFLYCLLPLFLITTNVSSQSQKFVPAHSAILSSEKGTALLKQCSRPTPSKVKRYFDLTAADIQALESNFKKILHKKATDCCLVGIEVTDLEKYCFQYVGVVIKGKKYIYINAFSFSGTEQELADRFGNWKVDPVIICDGGAGFWGALYEIKTAFFTKLSFNGSV